MESCIVKGSLVHRCKVCQSSTTDIHDEKKRVTYYRCSVCGFVFLDDAFIVDEVREKKQYDQHKNGLENEGYVQMFEEFIEISIAPYLNDTIKTALDFGSGPGPVLSTLLQRRGLVVDIYDLYYAPKKVYKNKKYHLITSTEVFEHLHKPLEVLRLLAEHTHSGGYIVLMTKSPPKDDQAFLAWWYRRDPTHISFFTPQSFEIMADKVALRLLETVHDNIVIFQK